MCSAATRRNSSATLKNASTIAGSKNWKPLSRRSPAPPNHGSWAACRPAGWSGRRRCPRAPSAGPKGLPPRPRGVAAAVPAFVVSVGDIAGSLAARPIGQLFHGRMDGVPTVFGVPLHDSQSRRSASRLQENMVGVFLPCRCRREWDVYSSSTSSALRTDWFPAWLRRASAKIRM